MQRLALGEYLAQSRRRLLRLEPVEAHQRLGAGACLIDVRTETQIARDGSIPGAVEITLNVLEWRLDPDSGSRHALAPDLDDLVMLLCDQGYSSSLAAARLQVLGFLAATDVVGGFQAWREAGLPVAFSGGDASSTGTARGAGTRSLSGSSGGGT